VSIFLYRDDLQGFSAMTGAITGFLLGGFIIWKYDEIMKFERWSIILTENAILVPEARFKKKTFLLAGLDKQRTLAYNSESKLRNRIRYTIWSINGESIVIGKSFYGRSQVYTLLEEIGLSKT